MDNVDTEYCKKRGIKAVNIPDYCEHEVAEHALAMLLALIRGIPERNTAIKAGNWNINSKQRSIFGSCIGVVGFGPIGVCFTKILLGFQPASILIWSPNITQKRIEKSIGMKNGDRVKVSSFEELVKKSDYISLHIKLLDKTKNLINSRTLKKMKPGAILINTSRGGLVDHSALSDAIKQGHLAGAALDTLDEEPPNRDHPILTCPNVIITDHCAYRSTRSLSELQRRCAEEAVRELRLGTE
jgi:D-3-phosphoglycerate dehydrogenase